MAYKMMNQDFVKLDKFDGSNFIRWQDKMKFLLTRSEERRVGKECSS